MKYKLITKPNWAFEIANCLLGQNKVNADEFVKTASEKMLTQKQAEEYMSRYRKFSDKVEGKINKAAQKYPDLYKIIKPLDYELHAEYYVLPNLFYLFSKYFFDIDEEGTVKICLKSIPELFEQLSAGESLHMFSHIMQKTDKLSSPNDMLDIQRGTPEHAEYETLLTQAIKYIMYNVLTYYAGEDTVLQTKHKEYICDMDELVSLLNLLDQPYELKYKLIILYSKGIQIIYDYVSLLEEAVPVCLEAFPIIQEDYDRAVAELTDEAKTLEAIDTLLGIRLDFGTLYYMGVSIFRYNIFMIIDGDVDYHIRIGMYIFDIVRRKSVHAAGSNLLNDEKLLSQLKAISEPSRLHIMKLLTQSPKYMQELANELSLTTATVSHHLTTLMQCDLIQIVLSLDKKKVYYQINENMIIALSDTIKSLIGNKHTDSV